MHPKVTTATSANGLAVSFYKVTTATSANGLPLIKLATASSAGVRRSLRGERLLRRAASKR